MSSNKTKSSSCKRSKEANNILKIQEYIIALEGILFYSQKPKGIDCSKLSENSVQYDPEYDSKVRRTELNVVYFLDEIITSKKLKDAGMVCIINEIENAILSPSFYRELILDKPTECFVKKTKDLYNKIDKSMKFVENEILEDEYKNFLYEFKYLNPSKTKKDFLKELETFAFHLKQKSEELENKVVVE